MTLLTQAGAAGAGAGATTGAIDTTGAGLLVAIVSNYSVGIVGAPTDSKGNTWTRCDLQAINSISVRLAFYVSVPSSVGSGHTFTSGGQFTALAVLAFDVGTVYPRELAWLQSTGTTIASTGPTGTVVGSVAAVAGNIDNTVSAGNGYSISYQAPVLAGQHMSLAAAYLIGTGAQAPSFSWSGSEEAAIGLVDIYLPTADSGAGGSGVSRGRAVNRH